jgi:uncharacterized membrane protein YhhN
MINLRAPQKFALVFYVVVAAVNVVASAADSQVVDTLTKPFLMPTLALVVALALPRPRDRWLIVSGLLLATAGDITLSSHSTTAFIIGMVFFLGTHLLYISAFVRGGALDGLRAMYAIPIAYALVFLVMLASLWSGLGGLRIPIAIYAIALSAMAACAATFGKWIGLGGLIFLVSDSLIAVGVAHPHAKGPLSAWIMLAYVVGQGLIATGWTRVQVIDESPETDQVTAVAA